MISIINEKGGSGKSTVATNLATALHRAGKRVVLLDADIQATARDWKNASPEGTDLPPVFGITGERSLKNDLASFSDNDFVVIDGPARADELTDAIVGVADIGLIVIQPSGADIWASAAAVKLINKKKNLGGRIDACFLLNRVSGVSRLSKEVIQGGWNEYGIDQMQTTIGNRVAFAKALTDGLSVYDLADGQAKAEIDFVVKELEEAGWL